jgi:hypothetical protein
MNAFQAMRGGRHFGHCGHDDVGRLRGPKGVFGRLHVLEIAMDGYAAPRAAALFGARNSGLVVSIGSLFMGSS